MQGHAHQHDELAQANPHAPSAKDEKIHSYYQVLGLALKELLIEKGVVTPAEIRQAIEFRDSITPAMGAKVVARAWTDPAYKQRLLRNGTKAIKDFGFEMGATELVVVENTPSVHNVIVCTLCSCYPRAVLGLPPSWYKSREYRARTVREPRAVLREFGTVIPESVEVRVHDSTADMRYLVLPMRPQGTESLNEQQLAALVTRDSMVGVSLPKKRLTVRSAAGAIVRVASCNFIEAYDFVVYGYYAGYIASAFFPAKNSFTSLMLSLATFGAGYLMRPAGAIVLGAYIDRKGRKKGLILTLALMAAGTLSIAVTPSYATIGAAAPLIVIAGRLVQGLSAGAEFGGVAVYLSEIATPGHRGFYCSWQGVSQQVAVVFAAVFGVVLTWMMSPQQMAAWGWRIPLFAGLLALPLILWLRHSLQETEAFQNSRHVQSIREVLHVLATNWKVVANGIGLAAMTTCAFYLITAYTPTYARAALNLPANTVFLVTMLVGASNLIWLPIAGMLSDRIGARPMMQAVTLVALTSAYPAMLWLVAAPSAARLVAVLLLYSAWFGLYYGAMTPLLAEAMPPQARTTGYSFSFVTATALLGGFTPAICTFLIQVSGNRAAPALWLGFAAALSFVSVWLLPALLDTPDRLRPEVAE